MKGQVLYTSAYIHGSVTGLCDLLVGEGFILVGGKSSRMGKPKAFLPFGETTLVGRSIALFGQLGLPARLVTDTARMYDCLGLPVLPDRIPSAGPLGGIYTGLVAAEANHCFFLPSDMPLLKPKLFRSMLPLVGAWDAIVPEDCRGNPHPLCAYYSKRCLDTVCSLLDKGGRKVGSLIEHQNLRILRLPVRELGISDDQFLNVNTPDDYRKSLEIGQSKLQD
jgi:molybdopterin-guanine dinucleotide biosynthesis protein A